MAKLTPEERAIYEEYLRRGLDKKGTPEYSEYAAPVDTPDTNILSEYLPDVTGYLPQTAKEAMQQGAGMVGDFAAGPIGAAALGGVGNLLGQYTEQGAVPPFWTGGGYTEPVIPEGGVNVDWGEVGSEAATQGVGSIAGLGLGKGIVKAKYPATRTLKQGSQEAKAFLEARGGRLAAPQESTGKLMGLGKTIAETGLTGQGTIEEFGRQYQTGPIRSAIDELSGQLGSKATMDDAGNNLVEAILGSRRAKMRTLSSEFKAIDEAVGNQPIVDLKKSKELWKEIVRKQPAGGSEAGRKAQQFLEMYEGVEKTTYERAAIEQSDLFEVSDAVKKASTDNDVRLKNKMRNDWIRATYNGLQNIEMPPVQAGSTASNEFRRLTQSQTAADARKKLVSAYRDSMSPYSKKEVKALLRTDGGVQALDKVFNQQSPSKILKIKAAVGGQKEWEEIQSAWLADKMKEKWVNEETGLFEYRKFLKEIEGMGASYDAIFSGSQKKSIDELLNAIKIVENKTRSKTGAIWIQLKQASALSALGGTVGYLRSDDSQGAAYGALSGATMALVSPYILAKMFTNPTMASHLAKAIKTDNAELFEKISGNYIRQVSTQYRSTSNRK